MSHAAEPGHEPGLFDLPLGPAALAEGGGRPRPPRAGRREAVAESVGEGEPLPLFPEGGPPGDEDREASERPEKPRSPALGRLLAAGLLDLSATAGAVVLVTVGSLALGIPLDGAPWAAFVLFGLVFSFLYQTVPLAFWGCTPGMAWAGIDTRTPSGERLTFVQAMLRWLGAVATLLGAGLPLLLALRDGRSLTDRLSGSVSRDT